MTLYNNFWLKRGVGLFSGDYGNVAILPNVVNHDTVNHSVEFVAPVEFILRILNRIGIG